ncbi:MAG TPA: hypothetical protein VGW10_01680 [Solirubrobacteraceae bacterium]|nr:hypothetical protein [Solirubrobacteraceae bacterium]
MTYVTAEARQELLDEIARAIDELGVALSALGDAYEQLDERSADTLEEELFRPVQAAYGQAKRAHAAFASRHSLAVRTFAPAPPAGAASHGVKGFLESAVEAVEESDALLSELQDSLLPVEVGDQELRAGLAETRRTLGEIAPRAAHFVSRFGR